MGASTKGRINLVTFGFDFTSHHASGTPRSSEMVAESIEVHKESFTALNDPSFVMLVKKVDHGTLITKAMMGSAINRMARYAKAREIGSMRLEFTARAYLISERSAIT
jgi:hypothetical protein